MEWIYQTYGTAWSDDTPAAKGKTAYGVLDDHETEIRAALKADFPELKEKQIKDLLDADTWRAQLAILQQARQLQAKLGPAQHDDFNGYDAALKATGLKLDPAEKKQIQSAVSWKNPAAAKVLKTVHKTGKPDPIYGRFADAAKIVEYEADGDLRDFENVALDPTQTVNALNEAYFKKEVLPHVPDAWIDATKRDPKDDQVGLVGYEIPFSRHFYEYQPPRDLAAIDADLDAVSAEIMKLLQEVHS
jgi:type I restriction enzyme M protein